MSQTRERKVAQFIEDIEKIHQLLNEKERQEVLDEKRGEILEDIFPTSSIAPEDNFCQIKDIRITKEGYIHPNDLLSDCIARKKIPNGINKLTKDDIFQSDILQKIQKAAQVIDQENLAQYATNNRLQNELVVIAKEIATYEQQNAELAKEVAQLASKPLKQPMLEESKSSVPNSRTQQEEKIVQKTLSSGIAFSAEDFFAFEEKANFYISDQGEIYQGPDLPKKNSKNPIIVKSYHSTDLNKIHDGYKTLQIETLILQQKEKALQQNISLLKEKHDALKKINLALLEEVQLLREEKRKRKIESKKRKEAKQKERKERTKEAGYFAAKAAQDVLDYAILIDEIQKSTRADQEKSAQFNQENKATTPALTNQPKMTYSYCRPILKVATNDNASNNKANLNSQSTTQGTSEIEQFVSAIRSADLSQIRKNNLTDIIDTDQCYRILDALTEQYEHQNILNLLIDELGHSPHKLLFGIIQHFNYFCRVSFAKLTYSNKLLSNLIDHPKIQASLDSPYEYFFFNSAKIKPYIFAKLCKCGPAATKLKEAQTKSSLLKTSNGMREGLNLFAVPEQGIVTTSIRGYNTKNRR